MLIDPLRRFIRKYTNIAAMDHYNEMDKQEKEQIDKEKSTLWKSERDSVKEVQSEYKRSKDIKKQLGKRKNYSNFK